MIDSGVLEDDFAAIIAQKEVGVRDLLRKGWRYLNDLKKGKSPKEGPAGS